jgi:DNA-binding transcriptional MerR regulator
MTDDDMMTIREMCEAFDVTARTLRFYEQKELLFPTRIGQKRLYNRRDRARLKLILKGKRFGVSLEDIRQLLDTYDREGAAAQVRKSYEMAKARMKALEAERDQIDATIRALKEQMAWGAEVLGSKGSAAA